MARELTLGQAVHRKGILLDSNVLPHFFTSKHLGTLNAVNVRYPPADLRFKGVRTNFNNGKRNRCFTSLLNVIECLGEKSSEMEAVHAMIYSFRDIVQILIPRDPACIPLLGLYATRGHIFEKPWEERSLMAALIIQSILGNWAQCGIWADEQEAKTDSELLGKFIAPMAIRDRGWCDIYTAKTAIDHDLVLLTEDWADFAPFDDLEILDARKL